MNKKKITIITLVLLIAFVSCDGINPFSAGGVQPSGSIDNDWIYYAEQSTIKKMRMDGTGIESVFTDPLGGQWSPRKIQLDPNPIRRKMYIWYEDIMTPPGGRIVEYNLDGTGENVIHLSGTLDIADMTIDHITGYLYFISTADGIKRINLSNLQEEVVYNVALAAPSYVTPDYKGGVYFYLHIQ